jgi:hypothetical protein
MNTNKNYIDLKKLEKLFEMDSTEILNQIINQHTLSSQEVMERFNISKQRLFGLKKQGLLHQLKQGLFIRKEVEQMRMHQIEDTIKYSNYDLTPAFNDKIQNILLINKLRFFDCLTMVNHNSTNPLYNNHLEKILEAVYNTFKVGGVVYLTKHENFDYVETKKDLEEAEILIRSFTKDEFVELLTSVESLILGMPKIKGYHSILTSLNNL